MPIPFSASHWSAYIQDRSHKEESVWYALGATALIVTLGYYYRSYSEDKRSNENSKPWPVVPGALPIIGHFHLIESVSHLPDVAAKWADAYGQETGCFEVHLMGVKRIFICREDRAMEILRQRPSRVYRTMQVREATDSMMAQGVFSAEGEQWTHERKLVSAALNQKNVQEYLPTFKRVVDRLVSKWKSQCNENEPVVIDPDLNNLASEAISQVALNKDFDFLNQPDSQMAKDVKVLSSTLNVRALAPVRYWRVPFFGQYLDGAGWSIFRAHQLVLSIIYEFEASMSESSFQNYPAMFISKVYQAMRSEKTTLSKERLAGNVATLFLAGTETTASTVTTALYLLAKDPTLQSDLRPEADSIDIDTASMDDIVSKVPRIKSFLHEVHLHYGAPVIGLETVQEIPFCGVTLAKGTLLLILTRYINTTSISPSKDTPLGHKGEPPSQFCPRRWLVPNSEGSTSNTSNTSNSGAMFSCPTPSNKNASFLPFGYGVRSCPGRTYSEVLSLVLLVKLLQTFEWELTSNHPPVTIHMRLTMCPDQPICLNLRERSTRDS